MKNTKIFMLQILTSDFGLLLKTEVTADSIPELQQKSKTMVSNNKNVKGMTYRIFSVIGNPKNGFISKMLKQDVIALNF